MNLTEILTIPAEACSDKELLWFEGRRWTYDDFQGATAAIALRLTSLGVAPLDRVAVLDTPNARVLQLAFATASLGATFVPLNFRARGGELAHMLQVATPVLALAGERYLDDLSAAARDAWTSCRVLPIESLGELAVDRLEPAEVTDHDIAVLMFTSGTTAAARAVMLTHTALVNFVLSTTELTDGSDTGAVLIAAPLHHIAGLTAVLTATFAGRRIVLMRQFDPGEWLRLVRSRRVTHAFLVPTMLKRVLDEPSFASADLTSLRVISYGAAPAPISVVRRALEMFPPEVAFLNAYGQTETTSTITMLGPEDHRLTGTPEEIIVKLRRLGSVGMPLPGVEIAVLADDGRVLPPGEVGEIAVRSDRSMAGYYGQEDATRSAFQKQLLLTRDRGWLDEDGYLYLAGRKSDLIIRGGENVSPEEVELVLTAHPQVEEAGVVGMPDEEWGERILAVVVPCTGSRVSERELIEYCRTKLSAFKKPDRVVLADALPRNHLGKLLRTELRARYADLMKERKRR